MMMMMKTEEIVNNVDSLLSDRGLVKEYKEQAVRLLLYHLYVAIDIYRYMTVAERNKAGYWYRIFKDSYTLRNFLKERKRKRDKEKSPLHPSYKKESGVKEKAQNNTHTAERESSVGGVELMVRKEAFRQECQVPKLSKKSAVRKLRSWILTNPRLRRMIEPKAHDLTPKQVKAIVGELGEP